ncbi:MAG: hypothetical protein WC897_04890 [Candidatus Gracilibacteria bacterium]
MPRCIYCLQEKPIEGFSKREHVISQFLGTFEPDLYFQGDTVCDQCNNELSGIETVFAEDSWEGVQTAMLKIRCKKTVRLRGERIKFNLSSDGNLGVFNNLFPQINPRTRQIEFRPHVVIRTNQGGYHVLFIDTFSQLTPGGSKYQATQRWLLGLDRTKIHIFADNDYPLEVIIRMLADLGVTYREEARESYEEDNRGENITMSFEGEMDDIIRRVPCKIAFNYFALCANASGFDEIIYRKEFDAIRNFIKDGTRPNEGLPIRLTSDPTLYNELRSEQRIQAHQVSFLHQNGRIKAKVTLLGYFNYEIDLGKYPLLIDPRTFGCGSLFDPFNQIVLDLQSSPVPILGRQRFALFNR